jgi:Glycosyltransferase family 87
LCLWSVYIWNLSTPGLRDRSGNLKGADFLHFYVLGSVALAHRGADLYNMNAQASLAVARVPQAAGIRYLPLYPPQVSIFFAPWARLPYAWAFAAWSVFSALIYALCCYAIWRACPNLQRFDLPQTRWTVLALAAGFPAFFHLIAWGQTSALALACFTVAFLFLRGRREFLAGVALGLLVFKPQLGLTATIIFACVGCWRLILGALLSSTGQFAVGWLYYGAGPLRDWYRVMQHARDVAPLLEPRPYQTHCLLAFWTMLVPQPALALGLYLVSALAVLALAVTLWRTRATLSPALRYSSLLVTTVLVAPHLTVYDLIILAPAFILLADWLIANPSNPKVRQIGLLLYLAYVLPLVGPLTLWTHVQLSVLAMSAVVYTIWQVAQVAVPHQPALAERTS